MISNLKRLIQKKMVKNTGIYLVSSFAAKLVPFLCLPVITNHLIPSEYGLWTLFLSIFSFILPIISMSFNFQISRTFFKNEDYNLSQLIFNLLLINVLIATGIFTLIILAQDFIIDQFPLLSIYFKFLPFLAVLQIIKSFALTIFIFEKKPIHHSIFTISSSLLFNILCIFFVVQINLDWVALLYGYTIELLIFSLSALIYMYKNNYLKISYFNKDYVNESLKICLPLVPHALAATVIAVSDRLILNKYLSTKAVGIYSLGYSFGLIMNFLVRAVNNSWSPWIYQKLKVNSLNNKIQIVKVTYMIAIFFLISSALVAVVGHIYIVNFLDIKYKTATSIVYWIAAAYLFRGLYVLIYPYMTDLGKTIIFPIATVISSIVNFTLTVYLVQSIGMVGAAQATLVSFILLFIIIFMYSQYHYPLPWIKAFYEKK